MQEELKYVTWDPTHRLFRILSTRHTNTPYYGPMGLPPLQSLGALSLRGRSHVRKVSLTHDVILRLRQSP